MGQFIPVLERQLRRLMRDGQELARRQPRLAGRLGALPPMPDPHVNRMIQGTAMLHARAALLLAQGAGRMDEIMLDAWYPEQLRPFPPCSAGPSGVPPALTVTAASHAGGPHPRITLQLTRRGPRWPAACPVFLDGDPAFCTALRQALLTAKAWSRQCDADAWRGGERPLFAPAGLTPEEALLPRDPGSHAGLALLRELLAFPRKFNLLRMNCADLPVGAEQCQVQLALPRDAPSGNLLAALTPERLRPGWVVRAHLFPAAARLAIDPAQTEQVLCAPPGCMVFSIDEVTLCRGGQIWPCRPMLQGDGAGPRWHGRREAGAPPERSWRLSFSGLPQGDGMTAAFRLTCCASGASGRMASPVLPPPEAEHHRRLLTTLLAQDGMPCDAASLRQVLATQMLATDGPARALLEAVAGLEPVPCVHQSGRAAPLQGTEVRLTVDERALSGCGVPLFGQVMDAYFAECAHMNSFTRLVLLSAHTGEELMRCRPRNGTTLLD